MDRVLVASFPPGMTVRVRMFSALRINGWRAGAGLLALSVFGVAGAVTNWTAAPVERVEGMCRFILHGYPLLKADGERINFVVSDLLKRQSEAFGVKPPANLEVRLRMFGRFEEFCQYGRTNYLVSGDDHAGAVITNLAGYFTPRENEVVTWRQKDPSYLANNILHECSHALSHRQFRAVPKWLNEGCAVFFSFPRYLRDAGDERELQGRWQRLKQWREEGTLPPVRAFVDQTAEEFRKMPPEVSYAVSWSLFQFLLSTTERREAMQGMVRRWQRRGEGGCGSLLEELYPGGVVKLEKDWHGWIARGAASVLPAKPDGAGRE